ncbi:hypothetical protein HK096_003320 [Nowakowskiella sp. JEL0078]|nr:hypothetical protein HK096_003320 [Nowakowskiella sp. JEL0078]
MKTSPPKSVVVLLCVLSLLSLVHAGKYSAEFRSPVRSENNYRQNVKEEGAAHKSMQFKDLHPQPLRGLRAPLGPSRAPLGVSNHRAPLGPGKYEDVDSPHFRQPVRGDSFAAKGNIEVTKVPHGLIKSIAGTPSRESLSAPDVSKITKRPLRQSLAGVPIHKDDNLKSEITGPNLQKAPNHDRDPLKSDLGNSKAEVKKEDPVKNAKLRSSEIKSYAATADKSLSKLKDKEVAAGKNSKLSVDEFISPHAAYRAALEVYHASSIEKSDLTNAGTEKSSLKNSGNTGDVPTDVKSTLNNVTSPSFLVGAVNSLNWSTGTAGIILIIAGLAMAFFGYALFKVVLFIGGFFLFSGLAYVGLNIIQSSFPSTANAFAQNGLVIYFVVCMVVGALGGGLTLCLWRVGLSAIGGLLGFVAAVAIEQCVEGGLIKSEIGRIVFIAIFVIVFAIAIHFLEKPLIILGTALPGSYAAVWGLDIFINTGFKNAAVTLLQNSGEIHVTTTIWIMFGAFIGIGLLGGLVQFFVTSKKHHGLGRGRGEYKNIEKENA